MGARPSQFRKGGGFLNNVAGVITGYLFTDEFGGEPFKPGKDPKTKKERFHSLYSVLSVRVDGADEDITTTLFVGGADDFEVSEDGHVLTPVEDGRELSASTSWATFIISLVEAGFPETNLPEDEIDFSSIIGTRCQFVQRKNEEATKRLGQRKDKKTGKAYDRQDLVVEQVYDLPGAEGGKSNGKAKTVSGKKAAPVEEADEVSVEELALSTLTEVLGENDGKIAKSKLSLAVLKKLMHHEQREDVRKLIGSDKFLASADGIAYNKAKQMVELA